MFLFTQISQVTIMIGEVKEGMKIKGEMMNQEIEIPRNIDTRRNIMQCLDDGTLGHRSPIK